MLDMEKELEDLRENNNELVQKLQYWKMTAAQRENEKLDLMKEINELRLELSRIRSGDVAHARKLDAALQSASEEALSHLVKASSAVARTLELAKTYIQDRQELDTDLPRCGNLSNTPSTDKVNRVPPMMIGGRLMQPVVSLSRTLHSNNSRLGDRSPNQQNRSASERTVALPMHMSQGLGDRSPNQQNRSASERTVALPIHMLQEIFIPLTRVDAGESTNNVETDMEVNHADDSTEELALDDSGDTIMDESQNSENVNFEESQRLDVVEEDIEPEDEETPPRPRVENPLEGPSCLLDEPRNKKKSRSFTNFEPDSTTEFEENVEDGVSPGPSRSPHHLEAPKLRASRLEFSPTVRRRRASPPPAVPRRLSNNGRILKVLVPKMRLYEDEGSSSDASPPKRLNLDTKSPGPRLLTPKTAHTENSPRRQSREQSPRFPIRDMSPSKRLMRFDAPSPNGSTDSRVIVLENRNDQSEPGSSGVSRINGLDSQNNHSNNNHNRNNDDSSTSHSIDTAPKRSHRKRLTSQSRHNHNSIENGNYDNRSRMNSRDNHSIDNHSNRDSRDTDSRGSEMASECRSRRPRKPVVYKEKPLNRKLRR